MCILGVALCRLLTVQCGKCQHRAYVWLTCMEVEFLGFATILPTKSELIQVCVTIKSQADLKIWHATVHIDQI